MVLCFFKKYFGLRYLIRKYISGLRLLDNLIWIWIAILTYLDWDLDFLQNRIHNEKGFRFLKKCNPTKKEICIVGHGTIVRRAIDAVMNINEKHKSSISIVDIIRSKPFPKKLKKIMNEYKSILTLDEQTPQGSLGSLIYENLLGKQQIKNLSLPDKFIFENSNRSSLLDINGLSVQNIKKNILKLIK